MIIRIKYWSNWLLNLPFVLINSKQCLKSDMQYREISPHFCSKDSAWAPYEQAKLVSWNFSFSQRYFISKFEIHRLTHLFRMFKRLLIGKETQIHTLFRLIVSLKSVRRHCVSVVNNYADTYSKDYEDIILAKSTTTLTPCQCSQKLRGHRVGIVNDYTDTGFFASIFTKTKNVGTKLR